MSRFVVFALIAATLAGAASRRKEYLTPEEIDQIREAQAINDRVPLFLKFAESRLKEARILAGIDPAPTSKQETRKTSSLDKQTVAGATKEERTLALSLEEYLQIYEEMLRRLEEQLDQGADARKALKALLKETPLHQAHLRAIEKTLGEKPSETLTKALEDTASALEVGAKTLAGLEEKFKAEKKDPKEKSREKRN